MEPRAGRIRPQAMAYTSKQKKTFLAVLESTGTVKSAAKAAGMSVSGAYGLRDRNTSFRQRWEDAATSVELERVDEAEDAAFQRGVRGWEEPVYSGARKVGVKRKYSDTCLRLFLMAKKPDQWSEQHRTEVGATVSIRTELIEMPPLDPVLDARQVEGREV